MISYLVILIIIGAAVWAYRKGWSITRQYLFAALVLGLPILAMQLVVWAWSRGWLLGAGWLTDPNLRLSPESRATHDTYYVVADFSLFVLPIALFIILGFLHLLPGKRSSRLDQVILWGLIAVLLLLQFLPLVLPAILDVYHTESFNRTLVIFDALRRFLFLALLGLTLIAAVRPILAAVLSKRGQ